MPSVRVAFLFYFQPMDMICVNGKRLPAGSPVLKETNRGYRYGEGLFETMKVVNGRLALADLHFDRLFEGMKCLDFRTAPFLDRVLLEREILELCTINRCSSLARVRLSLSGGDGGLYDDAGFCQYLVECWPLEPAMQQLNENGLVTGVFPTGRKAADPYSHLKSSNFLIYTQAAKYAKAQRWNDALVLNTANGIADSTIANVFIVKNGKIATPALDQGAVAGVMRAHLLKHLDVEETFVSTEDILAADELFLTNAIRGIRWVQSVDSQRYSNNFAMQVFRELVLPAW